MIIIKGYDHFLQVIGDEEKAHLDRFINGRFTEQEMRSMSPFAFNIEVLLPLDKDPEYKRLKPYYELVSRVKREYERSKKELADRQDRFWGMIREITDEPCEIDRCMHCGLPLHTYTTRLDFGYGLMCRPCAGAAENVVPFIVHHYPGFVERDNLESYLWTDLPTFLKDHPANDGYHYEYHDLHIMEVSNDQSEWWVLWNIKHPKVMKDVLEGLPEWHPPN